MTLSEHTTKGLMEALAVEYGLRLNVEGNWTYWRESLPKVLEFVSQAFHQY